MRRVGKPLHPQQSLHLQKRAKTLEGPAVVLEYIVVAWEGISVGLFGPVHNRSVMFTLISSGLIPRSLLRPEPGG